MSTQLEVTNYLKDLKNAVLSHRLVVFVGAGLSKGAGYPSWEELIKSLAEDLEGHSNENFNNNELLVIPQAYYLIKGHDLYYQKIEKNIRGSRPTESHRLLCELHPRHIITTNYDNLIEKEVERQMLGYYCISCDEDIPNANGRPMLVKMHGDLSRRNIVLKEEDYLQYPRNFPLTEALVKSLLASHTCLFIGFAFTDWNIKIILSWVRDAVKKQSSISNKQQEDTCKHYLYFIEDPPFAYQREYLEKQYVKLISYRDLSDVIRLNQKGLEKTVVNLKHIKNLDLLTPTDKSCCILALLSAKLPILLSEDPIQEIFGALSYLSNRIVILPQELEAILKHYIPETTMNTALGIIFPSMVQPWLQRISSLSPEEKKQSYKTIWKLLKIFRQAGIRSIYVKGDKFSTGKRYRLSPRFNRVIDDIKMALTEHDYVRLGAFSQFTERPGMDLNKVYIDQSFCMYLLKNNSQSIELLERVTKSPQSMLIAQINIALIKNAPEQKRKCMELFRYFEYADQIALQQFINLLEPYSMQSYHAQFNQFIQGVKNKKDLIEKDGDGDCYGLRPEWDIFFQAEILWYFLVSNRIMLLHTEDTLWLFKQVVEAVFISLSIQEPPNLKYTLPLTEPNRKLSMDKTFPRLFVQVMNWVVFFFTTQDLEQLLVQTKLEKLPYEKNTVTYLLRVFYRLWDSRTKLPLSAEDILARIDEQLNVCLMLFSTFSLEKEEVLKICELFKRPNHFRPKAVSHFLQTHYENQSLPLDIIQDMVCQSISKSRYSYLTYMLLEKLVPVLALKNAVWAHQIRSWNIDHKHPFLQWSLSETRQVSSDNFDILWLSYLPKSQHVRISRDLEQRKIVIDLFKNNKDRIDKKLMDILFEFYLS